jgi:ketosteroid isomerase-like protein
MRWILITLVIAMAASSIMAQSKKEQAQIAADIRSVMDKQVTAWNAGNVDGFMQGYWRSPDLVFVSGDHVTRGWQPTLDNYKKSYDSRAKMGVLTFSDLEVKVYTRDLAIVLGSWALARDKDQPHGKFTLTFRKLKEGWRIVMDHTS